MNMHKSTKERERGRERAPWDTRSEPNPTQTDTSTQVERTERRSHFLLTCKREWYEGLCEWVCVSCMTLRPSICWLYFLGIREGCLIFARASSLHALEPKRSIDSTESIPVSVRWSAWQAHLSQTRLEHRERRRSSSHWENFTSAGHIFTCFLSFFYFVLHGAGVSRKAFSWLSHRPCKDFCSSVVTLTDVSLKSS